MMIIQKIGFLILLSAPLSIYLYIFCYKMNISKITSAGHTFFNSYNFNLDNSKFKVSSFLQNLSAFQWKEFQQAIEENNKSGIWEHSNNLISKMVPFLILEPLTPINKSCSAPKLRTKRQIMCTKNKYTKKVAILIQFGFDVDILEIHLNELFDVVDKFFIVESTWAHSQGLKKPLIWELVKNQNRFKKFHSKIVHFILDDADVITATIGSNRSTEKRMEFAVERLQEKLRWHKFMEWNKVSKFFNDSDILGFGDVDEIPSREIVNYLKHCTADSDPIDIGIWFPFGSIDQAFITDFPVYTHAFTLGDPTFWTLQSAKNKTITGFFHNKYPSRNRGKSEKYLLGGIHMTHYGYLPHQIVKRLTLSEGSVKLLREVATIKEQIDIWTLKKVERSFPENYLKPFKFRIFNLEQLKAIDPLRDEIVFLPWFYNCNRLRYPTWERKHDMRLD